MGLTKTTKYATIVLSVLAASLINEFIVGYVNNYYKEPTYTSVLIGMLVTVVIYVPLFGLVGTWMSKASKSYLKASKKAASSSSKGLFAGFLIALAILFVFFAKIRHGLDVVAKLSAWIK